VALSTLTCVNTSSYPLRPSCCTAFSQAWMRATPTPHFRYSSFTHKFSMTGRWRAVFLRSRSGIVDGRWDVSILSSMTSQHPITSGRRWIVRYICSTEVTNYSVVLLVIKFCIAPILTIITFIGDICFRNKYESKILLRGKGYVLSS
jgi:hypothetical protein